MSETPAKSNVRLRVGQVFTGLYLLALAASIPTDLRRPASILETMHALGYPDYLPLILGTAKSFAFITLIVPRTVVLREWAVAGLTILYTGAAVSHTIVQGPAHAWPPAVTLALMLVGYFATKLRFGLAGPALKN